MQSRRVRAGLWAVVGAALIFAVGAYSGSVSGGERGSFVMQFPAKGAECGGPSMRELTGVVVVALDSGGWVKRVIQPNVIEVSSHVVRNVGDTPLTIGFKVKGFPEDTEVHSRDTSWNPKTLTIERAVPPGGAVDFGVLVHLPRPLPVKPVLVDGSIAVVDVRTGDELSVLPVKIVSTGAAASGDCCE